MLGREGHSTSILQSEVSFAPHTKVWYVVHQFGKGIPNMCPYVTRAVETVATASRAVYWIARVCRRNRCWRGETGKRDGPTNRWASALGRSNPAASTAAPLTRRRTRRTMPIRLWDRVAISLRPKVGDHKSPAFARLSIHHFLTSRYRARILTQHFGNRAAASAVVNIPAPSSHSMV